MIRVERRCPPGPPAFAVSDFFFCLQAMLQAVHLPNAALELVLVDDATQAAINQRFLGCYGPTNILSFPETDNTRHTLGTLFLSLNTLEREAFLYGQNSWEHCVRLLAHGLAHLLGYDHGPEMDEVCLRLEAAAG